MPTPKPASTKRISVTIDGALVHEIKELAGNVPLSAVITDALRVYARRLGMLAYLDEVDREHPITAEEQAAGERLWQQLESSSTLECSRRSPKAAGSASHSAGR